MKYGKLITNIFILIILSLFLFCLNGTAIGETFYVEVDGSDSNDGSSDDSDDAFMTIQGAIDNSSVEDYDTIYVGEGTFVENITVSKSVTIYGEGTNNTIIKAENSEDNIITVSEDDVTIKYLAVTGTDDTDTSGIYVEDGIEGFALYYCELTDNYIGCYLDGAENATVYDNDFTENEIGLYLNEADDTSVSSNDFEENYTGIFVYDSDVDDITENNFEENDYGIYLNGSDDYFSSDDSDDLEDNNSFEDNTEEDVYLDDDDNTFSCFISSTKSNCISKVWGYVTTRFKLL